MQSWIKALAVSTQFLREHCRCDSFGRFHGYSNPHTIKLCPWNLTAHLLADLLGSISCTFQLLVVPSVETLSRVSLEMLLRATLETLSRAAAETLSGRGWDDVPFWRLSKAGTGLLNSEPRSDCRSCFRENENVTSGKFQS